MKKLIFLIIIGCSAFKNNSLLNIISVRNIKTEGKQQVSENYKKAYIENIPKVKDNLGSDYRAYIYGERTIELERKAVFVYVVRDSYSIIHMLILNKNEELINTFEVAGVDCPFAEELEDGSVEWCGDRFSVFENDSTFNLVDKKIKTDSFLENSKCHIDSTVTTYKINYKAQIEKLSEKNYHFERIGIHY